ncbi:MAG: hypothetical protein IT348_05050 [Candidatus Eisenbacteria bacterium]|nr:hypothetical protein [Candidatus Eisenbacteria bacterium]
MAKKFFYVCAGIFLLALSYHFGANTATAQGAGNSIVGGLQGNAGVAVVTTDGDVIAVGGSTGDVRSPWSFVSNVFAGTSVGTPDNPVTGCWAGASGNFVVTARGDIFQASGLGGPWIHSNVGSAPISTSKTTFGAVKAATR